MIPDAHGNVICSDSGAINRIYRIVQSGEVHATVPEKQSQVSSILLSRPSCYPVSTLFIL